MFVILLCFLCNFLLSSNGISDDEFVERNFHWTKCSPVNQTIYDFKVDTLSGDSEDLHKYKNKVLLIINVATFCAYTQQYNDFNPLITANLRHNLKIAAFPCNQFKLQEPAENHEILNGIRYVRPGNNFSLHEDIDVYGKLEVNGKNEHPLYKYLKNACPQTVSKIGYREDLMYNPISVNDITWNFEKFLIDRDGRPQYRFHPSAWDHGAVLQPFISELSNKINQYF